ncbi:MAG: DEAD/DEAH box helicase family protein [Duodenibacillus sp.]|nr:DEAD/DEAH box helicase family protein [Duodenibacillus sp.]
MELFSPGTLVRRKNNPTMVGTILEADILYVGSRPKQKVQWNNGTFEHVTVRLLEPAQEEKLTDAELLARCRFVSSQELKGAITHHRLNGCLNNIIYSLHITNTEFYPYQFQPLLTYLNSFNNAILIADEVGLGKTIEAGLIWTEMVMREHYQRLLVVCPASLCEKWQFELSDKFNVDAMIVNARELKRVVSRIADGETRSGAFIVSLQSIRTPRAHKTVSSGQPRSSAAGELADLLDTINDDKIFDMMIVDEAHHLRNVNTGQHDIVRLLRDVVGATVFLSATPLQTGTDNLHALLSLLDQDAFPYPEYINAIIAMNEPLVTLIGQLYEPETDSSTYRAGLQALREKRCLFGADTEPVDRFLNESVTTEQLRSHAFRLSLIKRLNRLNPLSQIMTRTLKRHVLEQRVVRDPRTVLVSMSKVEQDYYDLVTNTIRRHAAKYETPTGFMESMAQRQMTSCMSSSYKRWTEEESQPDIEEAERIEYQDELDDKTTLIDMLSGELADFTDGEDLERVDSKFATLREFLSKYETDTGDKRVLLFSFFKGTLRYLERRLSACGMRVRRVDGDLPREERLDRIESFKRGDFDILLSSEVASEGLDLQFVSCLVNYDLPWNPARIEQRIGRIDRIGQKADKITIVNFVYANTVESRIHERLLERLNIYKAALGVAEKVLGEQIRELEKVIFTQKLTPAEEERAIEQAALVIENVAGQKEEAAAASRVYEIMNEEVRAAQELERYVLGHDLLEYVVDYCQRESGRSTLVETPVGSGLYEFSLSVNARADMELFFRQYDQGNATTRLLTNDTLRLRFENRHAPEPNHIERVTQTHPLIQFVRYWREKNKLVECQVVACRYRPKYLDGRVFKNGLPAPGTYVFRVKLWSYQNQGMLRPNAVLAYEARRLDTGEALCVEDAELLVNKAARYGEDLFVNPDGYDADLVLDRDDEIVEALFERYDGFQREMKTQALDDVQFKIKQSQSQLEQVDQKLQDRLASLDQSVHAEKGSITGLKVAARKKYAEQKAEIMTRIAKLEKAMQEEKQTDVSVGCGLIVVEAE